MQKRYVVALDQGTTSCRAVVFDRGLRVVAAAQKPFAQHYPRPGWVEHDAMEIYATQSAVLWQVLLQNGISAREGAAVGIANQRETTVLWEKKTGLPVGPAIVWQCRRTAALCGELRAAVWTKKFARAQG
jgi:glycerol kinase